MKILSIAVSSITAFTLVSCGDSSPSKTSRSSSSTSQQQASKPQTECSHLSTEKIIEHRDGMQAWLDDASVLYLKTKAIMKMSPPDEASIYEAKLRQAKEQMDKHQYHIDQMNKELRIRGIY